MRERARNVVTFLNAIFLLLVIVMHQRIYNQQRKTIEELRWVVFKSMAAASACTAKTQRSVFVVPQRTTP